MRWLGSRSDGRRARTRRRDCPPTSESAAALACAAHFVSRKSVRPYGDVGVLMIRMRNTTVRVSSERETSRYQPSPGTPRPALLHETVEDYHFFALVASSTRYTSPRKFTSEWFERLISHVRDVEYPSEHDWGSSR